MQPVAAFFGQVGLPDRFITGEDYLKISEILEPGMVFLSRKKGELTNWLIPGYWTHAALYAGDGYIIESIGKGVRKIDLISFMLTKDALCLYKPLFCDYSHMVQATAYAHSSVGMPYDFMFESNNKAFYCSELVFECYNQVVEALPLKRREIWDELVYLPEDIHKDSLNWKQIWVKRYDFD